ncbi:uncharacterized protein LOC122252668 isoform X2 [Penaeus japonicus]|uniref:uncharacterized protein LOC122252668 isoform X2 n=1 Tax=Penaeus japonicus TaxID=27405 RepID=UPI001C717537|nr:uncharacterized protein LOC122252668 isoform X2 [Penaeus japonicus]
MREGKLPLRTILQNFINHVDTLEAKRTEGDDQYEQEFQDLKLLTESLKGRPEYCCLEGEKDVNRRKNRYKDILPYDYTRVVVSSFPGVPGSDYINGNYIRGASGSRAYIASQGPLPHTTADFWRMVVECEVQVIIMASNETEGGKHKCECYWVNSQNEERQFGNVTVSFVKARQVCPDFMVRTLKIRYPTDSGKTERTICQFHYVLWPDHGVPETVRPLLDMVRLVRDCQASETLPVLVHCSAGCGRTGTICAIDYVWGLLRAGRLTENLNLFGLVKEMRRQRVAMVQTREQYILLHRAVRELFKERLKVIDAHPYENIATDGTPLILREKESDYEELYVKPEKQDESAKPTPPTTAPSAVSTPTGSLTRYSNIRGNNDYLASSSPINSLERPVVPVPPLPLKLCKPPPVTSCLSPHSSPSPHISPIPQPSPVQNHCSPVPQPSPVSLPTANQAHRSYSISPSLPMVTSTLQPVVTVTSSSCSPGGSHLFSQLLPNPFQVTPSNSKAGIHPTSKLEKDAENAAHKRQVAQPSGSSPAGGVTQRTMQTPTVSGSPQPLSSSATTPLNTPNHTPTPLHSLSMSQSTHHLNPVPPVRSRTPSPGMTYGRSVEEGKHNVVHNNQLSQETSTKSSEIVRRPSIAELKELFEKAGDAETPGVRLSRSASSVTSRTSLSIHPDADGGFRIKRKSSLGAEETLQSKKAYEMLERQRHLNICPPPPYESSKAAAVSTAPVTVVSAAKPPSSPVYTSPLSRRRATHNLNDSQDDNSHSALLARVDDRPALPVKKSKSFRYARPVDSSTNTIASTRSPELTRKKADINTYFSLDRGKGDSFSLNKSESGSVNFIGDIPSPREGFKLSVYQMPNTSQSSKPGVSSNETKDQITPEVKLDQKPQIPPKKIIGERFRNARPPDSLYIGAPQPYTPTTMFQGTSTPHTPQSAPPVISSTLNGSPFWNPNQVDRSIYDCPKELQAVSGLNYDNMPSTSVATSTANNQNLYSSHPADTRIHTSGTAHTSAALPKPSPTTELSQETSSAKEYVNARVVRNPNIDTKEPTRYVYVPLPTKRGSRDNKAPHEYANCSLSAQSDSMEGEDPTEIYMDSQVVKKGAPGKFPVYDEVIPTAQSKTESTINRSTSKENISLPISTSASPGSHSTPGSATTPGSADYEVMDFGETSTSVDEVFETVNYELLGAKDRRIHRNTENKHSAENVKDFCSKKDLDPIARQVYLDCQDYLLHGTNKSPVPSLMPKPSEKDAKKVTKPTDMSKSVTSALDTSMDVDEVKSKVNVAPQGLRTRERRNSYRQAVNPVTHNETKTTEEKTSGKSEPNRSIHKYETIWFENGKHMTRKNNPSPNSQQNLHQQVSKSASVPAEREDLPQQRGSSSVYMQVKNPLAEDHGSNFNQLSNNKDSLFKEKLEEFHTLVNSIEWEKPVRMSAASPRLLEDDANSKGSGSNNSTLQSHSTSSSRDGEQQEPIYVNTPPLLPVSRTLSSGNKGQLPPKATRNCDPIEPRSPPPLRHSRTEGKFDNTDSRTGQQSPIINANSLYGTIATSTVRLKPPGSNSSSPSFQNFSQNQAKPPSPYHSLVSTATLPSRTTISPTPYHNIPPPKGFGNGTSPGNSPNPIHSLQQNRENHEPLSSSPYYNMAMFTSGKPNQVQRNIPISTSGQDSSQMGKAGFLPYTSPPLISNVVRQNFTHNQPPKAHIIGDIAIVGEESVRLRRPGLAPHPRTDVGSGCSSNDSRGSEGAPIAPPRIKRNSTAGLPRHSAIEPSSHIHNDRRCSTDGPETYRQTMITAKQSWPLGDDEPPPAVPAKTAAAYQYSDPPPPPPHNHPPSPHHLPLNHTHSPYLQPPPPKPVLQQSSLIQQHQHPQQPTTQPLQISPYQSPPVPQSSKKIQNQNSAQLDHHHRSPNPLVETVPDQKNSPSSNQNKHTVVGQNRAEDVAVTESSSESSDDEGIFHKFSAPNIFKKWRSNSNKQAVPQVPSSPKAMSSHFYTSREMKEEKDMEKDNTKGVKEQKDNTAVSSPTSPKPLVKAFERLKFNPKSVAANFKSYLSPRGDKIEGDSGGGAEGHPNDSPSGNFVNSPGTGTRNIQKSASSGPTITAFSQVVQDYKYPNPIPKKPAGPRDMPAQMRGSTPTNPQVKVKTGRPRQQYL